MSRSRARGRPWRGPGFLPTGPFKVRVGGSQDAVNHREGSFLIYNSGMNLRGAALPDLSQDLIHKAFNQPLPMDVHVCLLAVLQVTVDPARLQMRTQVRQLTSPIEKGWRSSLKRGSVDGNRAPDRPG